MKSSLKIVWKRNIAFLFSTKYIFYSWRHIFFKIPKNLIACSVFVFFVKADTKNHRFASAKSSNAALVKLTDLIIKNDHAIVCCFSVSDKYRQTANVIWLSTAWILLSRLEVVNKKPQFKKPASIWIKTTC